jgi:Holliday junction resolvasome RuvABC ATP-dependent DNA helicase subunit
VLTLGNEAENRRVGLRGSQHSASEILWRASRGVPRAASKLLRAALRRAHQQNQNLVDDHVLTAVIDEIHPKQEDKP